MPSDIDNDNIIEFLNFINNDIYGNINSKYIYYLKSINNLANNGSYEIYQYDNFINRTNKNFPKIQDLNKLINSAKQDDTINFHRKFCIYLWYWIYH